jgi:hypothetical protein
MVRIKTRTQILVPLSKKQTLTLILVATQTRQTKRMIALVLEAVANPGQAMGMIALLLVSDGCQCFTYAGLTV